MAIYRFAGLYVKMEPKYEHLRSYAEKYLYKGDEVPDDVIEISVPDWFIAEKVKENPNLTPADCEYIWSGSNLAHNLLEKDGFVLHASAVAYERNAYLFSAHSETGKSTHTRFWREVFGKDKVVIINDDKPAVREINGVFYASGTPFSGKSPASTNVAVPIKAVCFIHRSEKDEIKRLDTAESMQFLFEQTVRPKNPEKMMLLLDILDRFFKKVPVYSLGVTLSPESARFAYRELNK